MSAARLARPAQRGGIFFTLLVFLLLAALAGTLYLFRGPLLRAFGEWWVVDEELEKADAIVVLGGDSIAGDRVRHAVALYQRGWAPKLVLSGPPVRADFSEAELMEKEALRQGVPAADLIVARHPATNTFDEAFALRPALARLNVKKVIVVTSNFHTRRARRIFRAVYGREGLEVRVSASPDVRFRPDRWWQERDSRAWLFLEMVKTIHTWCELWRLPAEAPRAQAGLPAPPPAPPASLYLPAAPAL